jgi:peroxiredoxin Q/BCP
MRMAIDTGDLAPNFSTQTDEGRPFSLGDLRGKTVVLYFYPRADTAGCTVEACGIRDEFAGFQRVGAEVVGISPDTVEAQAAFKAKNQLPFTLLADPDHAIADQFGVWVLRQVQDREFMGVARTTFLIGPDGKVQRVFRQVVPAEHAQELLEALATPA